MESLVRVKNLDREAVDVVKRVENFERAMLLIPDARVTYLDRI